MALYFVCVAFWVETGKTIKQIEEEERAKELAKLTKNRGAIPTSVSDVDLLAALIQCEAGGEGDTGMRAVATVIMNRVNSADGEYARVSAGGSIRNVIFQIRNVIFQIRNWAYSLRIPGDDRD